VHGRSQGDAVEINAVGAAGGSDPHEAFTGSEFKPIGVGEDNVQVTSCRWGSIAQGPSFSSHNHDRVQLFRIRRVEGTAKDAREIRLVGRLHNM